MPNVGNMGLALVSSTMNMFLAEAISTICYPSLVSTVQYGAVRYGVCLYTSSEASLTFSLKSAPPRPFTKFKSGSTSSEPSMDKSIYHMMTEREKVSDCEKI